MHDLKQAAMGQCRAVKELDLVGAMFLNGSCVDFRINEFQSLGLDGEQMLMDDQLV